MTFSFKSTDEERHSAAHVLATAVKRLFSSAKVGVGPVTKDGFYYDFQLEQTLSREDLLQIENTANQIIQENLPFTQLLLSRDEAQNLLLQLGQIFKSELIQAIPDEQISFYKTGEEFIDLCRGPHVQSTGDLGLIKISRVENVFWRDDPTRPSMIRIHSYLFKNIAEFNEYLQIQKEVKEKNFINIARQYKLAAPIDQTAMLLSSHGTLIGERIRLFVNNQLRSLQPQRISLLQTVSLPMVERSAVFNSEFNNWNRSYKNLPLTLKYQGERESHINEISYLAEDVTYRTYSNALEILNVLITYIDATIATIELLGENITFKIFSSNLDDPRLKTISNYLQKNVISHEKILTSEVQEHFLRIEVVIKDAFGAEWSPIQLQIGTNDECKYCSRNNSYEVTECIECSIDILQLICFLVQENQMDLPITLHPTPVICIPISNNLHGYADEVKTTLFNNGIFCSTDKRSQSLKYKIRDSLKKHVPFVIIVGNKEYANKAVSVRKDGIEMGLISIEELITMIKKA